MNIVRVREEVKEMRKAGVISAKLAGLWLHAPMFLMSDKWKERVYELEPEYERWYAEYLDNPPSKLPKKYPFDAFVYIDPSEETSVYCYATIGQFESVTAVTRRCQPRDCKCVANNKRIWDHSIVKDTEPCLEMTSYLEGISHDWRRLYRDEDRNERAEGGLMRAKRLCCEVLSKTSSVLRIAPSDKKEPRSAEWKLGRTHYVILTPKQAQQCSKQRRGPTDREVVLAAHWRRAHFRRLMAASFTEAKRGKLVPVRHAWVGPKEWFGLDGKVYKVVE